MVESLRPSETEIPKFPGFPRLIQGGMGVGVSSWELARAVALAGEKLDERVLGVVSGTGLEILMINKLERENPDIIRALRAFPIPEIAKRIIDAYPFGSTKLPPKPQVLMSKTERIRIFAEDISVVANFVEVWLAKEGHNKPIGINYLEKVQLPRLPQILGAMLAGVDYVLMGAGIPNQVPSVLDNFRDKQPAMYRIDVKGLSSGYEMTLDPSRYIPENVGELKRPKFLAIVSSHVLAQFLANKVTGVDGFIIEGPTAGGHNAPPRGKDVNEKGQRIYTARDIPDLSKISALGLPFWLAGSYGTPEKFREAIKSGAVGVQIGSAFAICKESGLLEEYKLELKKRMLDGSLIVNTDYRASPSGYPFKIAQIPNTLSDPNIYIERPKTCTFGHLVEVVQNGEEEIIYRCSAGPTSVFERNGGNLEDTIGKLCLCSALAAGVGQGRDGEPAVITIGDDFSFADRLMKTRDDTFSAEKVVRYILGE